MRGGGSVVGPGRRGGLRAEGIPASRLRLIEQALAGGLVVPQPVVIEPGLLVSLVLPGPVAEEAGQEAGTPRDCRKKKTHCSTPYRRPATDNSSSLVARMPGRMSVPNTVTFLTKTSSALSPPPTCSPPFKSTTSC